ncbi:hypothetical protein KC349_g8698 [Hortaea werneckii]|nr:hypothetical protein KC349_g8698 [Hortaea werneckii]
MGRPVPMPMMRGLHNVFTQGEYSDLAITCGERTWKVHRLVLCTQSEYFHKACNGPFTEAQDRKIDLSDDDVHVLATMLHYLYHFDYDDEHHFVHGHDAMTHNICMALIADKYNVQPLLILACEKLKGRVSTHWDTPAFAAAISLAFGTASANCKRLRAIVLDAAILHAKELFHDKKFEKFQKAAREQTDFCFEYATAVSAHAAINDNEKFAVKNANGATWFKCPGEGCQKHDTLFRVKTYGFHPDWKLNSTVANTNNANKSSPGSFVTPEPLAPLINGLKRAFDSPKHADLTIICQDRQWKAHKVLLCAQSEWFQKACAEPWKEGKESTITFTEDEPEVVDAMLHWFYEFDYGISQKNKYPLVLDLRVHVAAQKYLLPNLKHLAATKFEQRAEKEWQSEDFACAIMEVYDGHLHIDDALKQTIVRIANDHRSQLFVAAKDHEMYKAMVVEIPIFGVDVLIASCSSGNVDGWTKYKCPSCGTHWGVQGKATYLGCPKGCQRAQTLSWWVPYKQA